MNKLFKRSLLLTIIIILLDQGVKILVKTNMLLGQEIPLLDDILKIHFVENPGAAFGLHLTGIINGFMKLFGASGIHPKTGKLLLTFLSFLILIAVAIAYWKMANKGKRITWILALILGGAVGNLIDRTFYGIWFHEINDYEGSLFLGRVVDMIYIDIWQGFVPESIPILGGQYLALWPIFNFADISISVAIILLLVFPKYFMEEKEKTQEEKIQVKQHKEEVIPKTNSH